MEVCGSWTSPAIYSHLLRSVSFSGGPVKLRETFAGLLRHRLLQIEDLPKLRLAGSSDKLLQNMAR